MSKKDGGPAFPTTDYYDEKLIGIQSGMTLRDWFAGQALGLITHPEHEWAGTPPLIAKFVYAIADAMIAERDERDK